MHIYSILFAISTCVLADVINVPLENRAVSYIASIEIGNPPTTYELLVDTGTSNTWIGASKSYAETSTSQRTSDSVSVSYGSGSFSGQEYIDTVKLAPGAVINGQSIGVASNSSGFSNVDGILGLGPIGLTRGTLSPNASDEIPTVIDNLFSQGTIDANIVGVSFEPITDSSGKQLNGELSLGGVDDSKFTGSITYAPITGTSPANERWGIDASINYGDTTVLSSTAGIVDSGTSRILIASDAFKKYQAATGGTPDNETGLLKITSDQFSNLKSLYFNIGGVDFELTPNAQIFPRALNSAIGGTADSIYLTIGDNGSNSGSGLDFILGQYFMERFYTVFDTANNRVGIATTPHTTDTTN